MLVQLNPSLNNALFCITKPQSEPYSSSLVQANQLKHIIVLGFQQAKILGFILVQITERIIVPCPPIFEQ